MNSDEQLPTDPAPDDRSAQAPNRADGPLIVCSQALFQGRREVWIEHGDEMYHLRVTSSGKLYLTK